MSYASDYELNIVDLPSDVIRHIIRLGQESIEAMKLISYRWNALANEHLGNPKRLPALERFKYNLVLSGHAVFRMQTSDRYMSYFGIENLTPSVDVSNPNLIEIDLPFGNLEETSFSNRLSRLFNRCSLIKQLYVIMNDLCHTEIDIFRKTLGVLTIHELLFNGIYTFTEFSASYILHAVRTYSTRHLVLFIYNCEIFNADVFNAFFSNTFMLVPSVLLIVPVDFDLHWNASNTLFFGLFLTDNLERKARVNARCEIKDVLESRAYIHINVTALKQSEE